MLIYVCTTGEENTVKAIFESRQLAEKYLKLGYCDTVTKIYTNATPTQLEEILEGEL